jgi:hypothetical protein
MWTAWIRWSANYKACSGVVLKAPASVEIAGQRPGRPLDSRRDGAATVSAHGLRGSIEIPSHEAVSSFRFPVSSFGSF